MISVTRQETYGHLSRSSLSEFHITDFYLIQQKHCQTWLGTKAGRVTGTRKERLFYLRGQRRQERVLQKKFKLQNFLPTVA